jgi:hypothetical protein
VVVGLRLQLLRQVKQSFPAWLDITVLDEELWVCRSNAGTLFARCAATIWRWRTCSEGGLPARGRDAQLSRKGSEQCSPLLSLR